MAVSRGHELESARRRVGMDEHEVWLSYFALGGNAVPADVVGYLHGDRDLDRSEHNVLAQAINEGALDRQMDRPAPYADD